MIRPAAALSFAVSLLLCSSVSAPAQTIYQWRDAKGGLHYSNESSRTPADASAVELPPLGTIQVPRAPKRARTRVKARHEAAPAPAPCGPANPLGLAEDVTLGLAEQTPEADLTLLVGGVPVATDPDASVETLVTPWDPDAPQAHLSQSAIAYPTGSSCPDTPPLVRYPTTARRNGGSHGLCEDYRRAFAQVGVATSRDAGIARSFREIARSFIRVSREGNNATASGFREVADEMFTSDARELAKRMTIPLDPWIVAAHVSQTDSLASESDQLVDQLTVALEEIDRAARATGCWN